MVTPLLSDLLPLPFFSSGCRRVHRCQSPLQHRSIEENSAAKSATPSGSESERKLLLIWLQNYPQYGPYMRELLIRGLRFRAMELDPDPESQIQEDSAISTPIDPRRACFPRCIVWSPLPVISWFIPFIGHVGICREDGVILDFAGPNFVCVDNFAFGSATQYIQINKEKCLVATHSTSFHEDEDQSHEFGRGMSTWDDALRKGTQEFQHLSYNLFTCNCHSFVANNLNRLGFRSGGWNVVNLAILFLLKGRWVSKAAMVRTLLPFAVVFVLGLLLGGSTFLTFWAFFTFLLVGWFIFGTYCLKDVIQL